MSAREAVMTDYLLENYAPIPESGCWLWLGGWDRQSYGKINKRSISYGLAHRAFYKHFIGPIPEGMLILHKCDTPPCINPDHLFAGSPGDNMKDMHRKNRHPSKFSAPRGYRGRFASALNPGGSRE